MDQIDLETEYLARRMFNAYGEHCGWKAWDGRPMPKWCAQDWPHDTPEAERTEINDAVRSHWRFAAAECAAEVMRRHEVAASADPSDILVLAGRDIIARSTLIANEGGATIRRVSLNDIDRALLALPGGDRFAIASVCLYVAMSSVNLNHVAGAHRAAILAYLQAGGDGGRSSIASHPGDTTIAHDAGRRIPPAC